jgi:hypothetical protein
MRILIALMCTLAMAAASCTSDDNSSGAQTSTAANSTQSTKVTERGGTITVGEETWTIVPQFCQIHSNELVNISGHAAEDTSLEISIDYGGPNQVVVGSGSDILWRAVKDSIEIQVEGKRVQGTATFNEGYAGSGNSTDGSFDINC